MEMNDRIIEAIAEFLEVSPSDLPGYTSLFMEYDLTEEDVDSLIELLMDKFEIEIDMVEFCELCTIDEIAEYITEKAMGY